MNRMVLSVLTVCLLAPGIGRSDDREEEFARLRGTWVLVEQAGKKPKREYKLIVTKANGYRMGGTSGESSDIALLAGVDGSIRLDPYKKPPEIDLVGAKNTLRGIYKLEADRLTLLVGPEGGRPTSFDKGDGTFHIFMREDDKK